MYTRQDSDTVTGRQAGSNQDSHISLETSGLKRENQEFKGKGGISQENRHAGFVPAFLDSSSGKVYRSRYADGRPAPIHLLDSLPSHLTTNSSTSGLVSSFSEDLISGFLRCGEFYTRAEAIYAMNNISSAGD